MIGWNAFHTVYIHKAFPQCELSYDVLGSLLALNAFHIDYIHKPKYELSYDKLIVLLS